MRHSNQGSVASQVESLQRQFAASARIAIRGIAAGGDRRSTRERAGYRVLRSPFIRPTSCWRCFWAVRGRRSQSHEAGGSRVFIAQRVSEGKAAPFRTPAAYVGHEALAGKSLAELTGTPAKS